MGLSQDNRTEMGLSQDNPGGSGESQDSPGLINANSLTLIPGKSWDNPGIPDYPRRILNYMLLLSQDNSELYVTIILGHSLL